MDASKSKEGSKNSVNFGSNLYHRPSSSLSLGEWIGLPNDAPSKSVDAARPAGVRSKPIMKRTDSDRDLLKPRQPMTKDLLMSFKSRDSKVQVSSCTFSQFQAASDLYFAFFSPSIPSTRRLSSVTQCPGAETRPQLSGPIQRTQRQRQRIPRQVSHQPPQ
jgi:hypothetical protein